MPAKSNNNSNITQDYYPFGMLMPGRQYNASAYKFGFNGMERDDKVNGLGVYNFTTNRVYNSLIGRWLSIDPKFNLLAQETPYSFSNNSPLYLHDPDGDIGLPYVIAFLAFLTAPNTSVAPTFNVTDLKAIEDARNLNAKWLLLGVMGTGFSTGMVSSSTLMKSTGNQFAINTAANFYIQWQYKSYKDFGQLIANSLENTDIADAFLGNISKKALFGAMMSAPVDLTPNDFTVLGIDKSLTDVNVDFVMDILGSKINFDEAAYSKIMEKCYQAMDNQMRASLKESGGDYEKIKEYLILNSQMKPLNDLPNQVDETYVKKPYTPINNQ